ncbi:MAG: DNA polymerase/3'-5' exonuclease PolX [Solirubrobacterales bacterium]
MKNADIAAALDELGDLYELDGAVVYRVIAYRQAAQVVRESPMSVQQLASERRLTELPGVGKTLEQKIEALLEAGEIPAAAKLKQKFPGELVEYMRIPGLGAKTARKIHDQLGIATLAQLREAAEGQQLREIAGLGPKAEQNILAALRKRPRAGSPKRRLLSDVLEIADEILEELRVHPAAERVEIAGSARRMADTCKDLDIVATSRDAAALTRAFTELEIVAETKASGEAGAKILTHNGLSVDFRVVAPEQFGNVLQHLTGSKRHNVELREYAVQRGQHVSEYGIEDERSGRTDACATEQDVYGLLGLDYIEPELREGRGELEAALDHTLPALIEGSDIKGDLHSHTTLSDGRATLAQMAEAARKRGYRYFAITDHSASFGFGDDVQPGTLRRRIAEIRKRNSASKGFRLLAGSEVNIHPDGSLDYDDELLGELDWVVASVHSSFRMSERRMTERIMAAMDSPYVDAIGHPTGRLLLRREPYRLDIERLVEHAATTGTMLEINANPNRRDLSDLQARLAAEAGAILAISSDAHRTETLDVMRYGIATARRAWLGPAQIANTRSWRELSKLRKRTRKRVRKATR